MEGKKFKFPEDIIAAITGSIAIIPDGMASGVMAKLNPVNGVYSAVVGLIVGAWTTNSAYMSVTTTSALALATGSAISGIPEEKKIAAVITLSVMAGLLQMIMGILNMGFLVRFVSNAVMRGFLTGVAVMIVVNQVSDFIGNYSKSFQHKVVNSFDLLIHLKQWDYITLAVSIVTVLIILVIERTKWEDYAIFISLFVVASIVFAADLPVKLVGDENKIPTSLPGFALPDVSLLIKLLPSSIAIALIGFIQSVGVSHMIPNPSGDYPKDSKDILGQGITNVACGMASGFPVGGSLAQTSLMINAGAKSRWANFMSGLLAGLLVLLLSKYIELLPMACFAAILIVSGIASIKLTEILLVWKTSWQSRLVMLFTFIATLAVSVQMAVFISVIVTFILHVIVSSDRVIVKGLRLVGDNFLVEEVPKQLKARSVLSIQPYGSLFFAGAIVLREKLPELDFADRSIVIINVRGRTEIGSSFIKVIKRYSEELNNKNSKLMLVGVNDTVFKQLERTGLLDQMGPEDIYKESKVMGGPLKKAWIDAVNWTNDNNRSE